MGLEARVGVNYYVGKTRDWVPEPEAPAPQALAPLTGGTLSAGTGTLCQGKAIVVRSNGATDPAGRGLTYKWKVDGQPVGSNSPELSFTPEAAGSHNVELEVSAENTAGMPIRTASAASLALGVQEYKAPTVSGCAAIPAELGYGDSAKLNATATGSTCSTTTFQWTAAEGTIADPTAASTSFVRSPSSSNRAARSRRRPLPSPARSATIAAPARAATRASRSTSFRTRSASATSSSARAARASTIAASASCWKSSLRRPPIPITRSC